MVRRVGLLLVLLPVAAQAQPADPDTPAAVDTPPRLISAAQPELPADAFDGRETAPIAIEIVVAADGSVQDVVIIESAGAQLDALIVEAARGFRFEPARSGTEAIESRVRLRLTLAPTVTAAGGDGDSDSDGDSDTDSDTDSGTGTGTGTGTSTEQAEPEYESVIVGEAFAPDAVRRTLTVDEIDHIAGTGGDAIRSVQAMPGVARAPGIAGILIVRGSEPMDTRAYIDGVFVPVLFHFGGLTSVVPTAILEGIDFFPGNFGSRYGNATGGIVEARTRRARTDGFHAQIDVDLIDAGVLVEGPLSENVGVIAAVRRSYIDAILQAYSDDIGLDFVTAPVYYDYQLLLDWTPTSRSRWRAFLFGSDDRFKLILRDPVDIDPAFRGNVETQSGFHRLQLRHDQTLPDDVQLHASVTPSYTQASFGLGNVASFEGEFPALQARLELSVPTDDGGAVRFGSDATVGYYDIYARLPAPPKEGEIPDPLSIQRIVNAHTSERWIWSGFFVEHEIKATRRLTLVPGMRLELYEPAAIAPTPRFVGRYQLDEPTVLKAGFGLFARAPDIDETDPFYGTPGLDAEKAIHASVGVERQLTSALDANVEFFGKSMWDLVTRVQADNDRGYDYTNDAIGRVYGMELLLRLRPEGALYGWIAYTLLRSERRDQPGQEYRLFDFDQTHIFNLVLGYKVGDWRFGARLRYVTGNPDTPVEFAIYDADADVYLPVFGPLNSGRIPDFHQLDVRVDYEWQLGPIDGSIYADVQNAYNQPNPEGFLYNFDYTERTRVTGLPILPSLGVQAAY